MPRVTITVPGKSPQPYRFQLDRRVVALGRGSSNDIVIDCGSVSVSHAEMRRIDGGFELADLQSTNGIKLDGERRELVPLQNGISLKLGEVAFDFQLSEEELEALAKESQAPKFPPLPDPVPSESPQENRRLKSREPVHHHASGGSWFWLLILALGALIFGMAVRFEKDTGESWLKAVISRSQAADPGGETKE